MRKIGRYAELAILENHRRHSLTKRTTQYISDERGCSTVISGLSVWPEFGGGGSPKQLAPHSGQSSSRRLCASSDCTVWLQSCKVVTTALENKTQNPNLTLFKSPKCRKNFKDSVHLPVTSINRTI